MHRLMIGCRDWSAVKLQHMARDKIRDGAVGDEGGLKPVINLIQADSRGNWEPLLSPQEGGCQASNYGNES